ncbi:peptide MFS transporter [Photobacterium damselae]|uniref:peptide MFS transporter n=1 Tax=Photobacterium damselae TaxID=38293 RepID=UPI0010FEF2E7|nr:peptide MFS transporter [Photobacterium damselae]MBA5684671.1 peptide MFS transporter [Photobacterium damselae subsp. damselae]MCG3813585.1 peptide MFS transporter [Photobacterium damselae]NVH49777.1 peptide MFS transporter [Photobacterium damselae subsp. damselae]NVO79787.1 peptide MFS transporter [Photobacterium damselae subsp. damselae]TLS80011.1 peptide MFS transporter [Photobacterium damselae subsp. damselae]
MSNQSSGTFMGHPKGLFLLFSTELWERFSYYAMRAILVLYLTDKTINGGLGWSTQDALQLYGTYTGLVYFTPLIGGWIADNILGQRRSIIIGGILMAIGQFTLALPHSMVDPHAVTFFYIGLGFLVVGNGLFKPNISTMVGDLYKEGDHRRDGAFTIFYMGINIGSLLAGVIAGTASTVYGWKAGFLCAGIGMTMSLIIQLLFAERLLGNIGKVPAAHRAAAMNKSGKQEPLTKVERDRLKVILVMCTFVIVFWAGFEQAGGLMNIYSQEYTNRMIGSFEVPAAWFQSLNPFFIIICAPILASIWVKMGKNEPASPVKFALAMFSLALGFACMIGAALEQGGDLTVKTSMMWLVGAYFFHTIGELCLSPIGLSLVTKLAPLRLASLMMGAWFGANAIANYVAGIVGSRLGETGPLAIFSGIAITAIVAGVLLLLLSNKLIDWMHGAEGHKKEEEVEVKTANA